MKFYCRIGLEDILKIQKGNEKMNTFAMGRYQFYLAENEQELIDRKWSNRLSIKDISTQFELDEIPVYRPSFPGFDESYLGSLKKIKTKWVFFAPELSELKTN